MGWSLFGSKGNEMSSLNCEVLLASSWTSWVSLQCHLSFHGMWLSWYRRQKHMWSGKHNCVEPLCIFLLCSHLGLYFLPITLHVLLTHEWIRRIVFFQEILLQEYKGKVSAKCLDLSDQRCYFYELIHPPLFRKQMLADRKARPLWILFPIKRLCSNFMSYPICDGHQTMP